ncbi:ABC transporter permease [Paenibacillus sp. LMG 31456]|uniref:ABC transporter permease n=1 Tax=Paenibacillus foliorum TaxID=2654974 RepID=A0A972GJE4_9BACL|nr:ABC transporter permease [Paenibacillus foliorum]NOU91864.1 ABC transporter permease [Paenibacillus foliorum]
MIDLQALYRSRAALFLKEIRPYLHYALQGGAMAIGIGFLLFSIGYRQFLQWVTPAFPWELLSAAIMLPALAGGRIRTYLQEADTLFLLPQENGMKAYLKAAMNRSLIVQLATVAVVWLIVWPLYHKLAGSSGWMFLLLLVLWYVYKRIMLFGKWTELQMQEKRTRFLFQIIRWILSATIAYGVIANKPAVGILLMSLLSIAYLGLLRLPRQHIVNWSLLIDVELQHRASIYRILNWFVDVPSIQGKARNVRGLDRATRWISFRQDHAYSYLYTLVWLRSELFGITMRLTLIGVLLLAAVHNDIALACIYLVFAAISTLQLSEMKLYYHEHVWQHIYPIHAEQRKRSVGNIRYRIHLGILVLLTIPSLLTFSNPLWAVGLLLLAAISSGLYHRYR